MHQAAHLPLVVVEAPAEDSLNSQHICVVHNPPAIAAEHTWVDRHDVGIKTERTWSVELALQITKASRAHLLLWLQEMHKRRLRLFCAPVPRLCAPGRLPAPLLLEHCIDHNPQEQQDHNGLSQRLVGRSRGLDLAQHEHASNEAGTYGGRDGPRHVICAVRGGETRSRARGLHARGLMLESTKGGTNATSPYKQQEYNATTDCRGMDPNQPRSARRWPADARIQWQNCSGK